MAKLFKIKSKYLSYMLRYSHTKLDLNGMYDKETWNKNGFKDQILEEVEY